MNLFEQLRKSLHREVPDAPDGGRDTLRSGKWPAHQAIMAEVFPAALLLRERDRGLYKRLGTQVVLEAARVGEHTVELILSADSERTVDLSLRVPTAANQFRDPYILMEAEQGNTREDAIREICFHLQGRIPKGDLAVADWRGFFASAAAKLEALRS